MGRFTKGLNRDVHPSDQPEGTWRYAKNAYVNRIDGAISNEFGTVPLAKVGRFKSSIGDNLQENGYIVSGYKVVGTIEITDDRIVIFSINRYVYKNAEGILIHSEDYGRSEIGVFEEATGNYTTYLNLEIDQYTSFNTNLRDIVPDTDLKFNASFPIEGIYKINAEEELVVYWTDNNNPPRSLNLNRQFESLSHSENNFAPYETIYGISPAKTNNKDYVDRVNLFPHAGPIPYVDLFSVTSGGSLETGIYSLALAYVDVDLNATNYFIVDNPVSIVEDVESVQPIERYDGAPPGTISGKAITWRLRNLTTDYKYVRPAVIQSKGGQQFAYQLHDIEIPQMDNQTNSDLSNVLKLTYSGTETVQNTSVGDIIIDNVSYNKAKAITQLDNVLYLGNLEGTKDIGFQPHAGTIKLSPVTKRLHAFDPHSLMTDNIDHGFIAAEPLVSNKLSSYRDPYLSYKNKGYMRDEVYAFYIAFILNDGSMSYAYHIPGRKAIGTELNSLDAEDHAGLFTGASTGNDPIEDIINMGTGSASAGLDVKEFHVLDSSAAYADSSLVTNGMSYWQNANETYPNTPAFDAPAYKNEDGTMANVRHHKFPSNQNENVRAVQDAETSELVLTPPPPPDCIINFNEVAVADGAINTLGMVWVDNNGDEITDFSDLSAYQIDSTPTCPVYPGNVYEIEWEWETAVLSWGPHTYNGVVVAVQEDNNWVLVSHEALVGGIFGSVVGDLLNGNTNYPNDLNMIDALEFIGVANPDWSGSFELIYGASVGNLVTGGGTVDAIVSVLGFQLDNVFIPPEIAKQVQGFRIYYAERQDRHKRILGQGIITPYDIIDGRLGGCANATAVDTTKQKFWFKRPLDFSDTGKKLSEVGNDRSQVFAFYNFEMLRRQTPLSPATHITPQWKNTYWPYLIASVNHELEVDDACNVEEVRSNAFINKDYHPTRQPKISVLKERCKTYMEGDTILDSTDAGFGYKLYNTGGETHIALGLIESCVHAANNTQTPPPLVKQAPEMPTVILDTNEVYTDTVNLNAFKTNVYDSLDRQNLVWTGFQVVGRDFDRFIGVPDPEDFPPIYYGDCASGNCSDDILGSTSSLQVSPASLQFTHKGDHYHSYASDINPTAYSNEVYYQIENPSAAVVHMQFGIFGGDTFLCRYGFRQSILPRLSTGPGGKQFSGEDITVGIYAIIETTDNIALRHKESKESLFFPGSSMKSVLTIDRDGEGYDSSKFYDLTSQPLSTYNFDYSAVNLISPVFPLPNLFTIPSIFSSRVQRSAKSSPESLIDNFRTFLSQDRYELPKNRGELWKLATFNNLLYIHMEDSLFVTKGKQSMQMKDGSEAFIGSGDIFAQAPDEILQTEEGYGGTKSQFAALVTKYGYFSVDQRNSKIYLTGQKMEDISNLGMEKWFDNNLGYEKWNISLPDSPIVGSGFVSGWDEDQNRILLTKRALLPTEDAKKLFVSGQRSKIFRGEGQLHFDSQDKEFKLGYYPNVEMLINGDFSEGNSILPMSDFSSVADFTDNEDAPSKFPFTIGKDFATRALSSGVFTMSYGESDPYMTTDITVKEHDMYTIVVKWKGEQGVKVTLGNNNLQQVLLETVENQVSYRTITSHFTASQNGQVELRVYGGKATNSGTLYIQEFSIFDSAGTSWETDGGFIAYENKMTHIPGQESTFSQDVSAGKNKERYTTFTVTDQTAGDLTIFYGDTLVETVTSNGYYIIEEVWKDSNAKLKFKASSTFNGSINSVSCLDKKSIFYVLTSPDRVVSTENYVSTDNNLKYLTVPFAVGVFLTKVHKRPLTKGVGGRDIIYNTRGPVSEFTLDGKDELTLNHLANIGIRDDDATITTFELWERVGWTLSYYPELKMWGSFHDYLPHLYSYTSRGLKSFYNWEEYPQKFWRTNANSDSTFLDLSINEDSIENGEKHSWRMFSHNNTTAPGSYYWDPAGEKDGPAQIAERLFTHPFIVEGIINDPKYRDVTKLFPSISYESEVFKGGVLEDLNPSKRQIRRKRLDRDGFTKFFTYNSTQHSSDTQITYLENIRKIGHKWNINKFRDMSNLYLTTFPTDAQHNLGSDYSSTNILTSGFADVMSDVNILEWTGMMDGGNVVDWVGNDDVHDMFEATWGSTGIYQINTHSMYIDLEKPWHQQRKFTDTYLGIRLVADNIDRNFVNLYSISAGMRKYVR